MEGAMFTSNKQDWETPQKLYEQLDKEFNFKIDLASSDDNAKCDLFFTEEDNALNQDWSGWGNAFCNPPYKSNVQTAFVKKAYEESLKPDCGKIVMLIPSRTDTIRWQDYILPYAEVRFLRGRLKFETNGIPHEDGSTFPSAVVIF